MNNSVNLDNLNLLAAKELVKRYKTITLEEIKEYSFDFTSDGDKDRALRRLTGFGADWTCTLCLAARGILEHLDPTQDNDPIHFCRFCVYGVHNPTALGCKKGEFENSFFDIKYAISPKELLKAYRNRSKLLGDLIRRIETENGKVRNSRFYMKFFKNFQKIFKEIFIWGNFAEFLKYSRILQ